MTSLIDSIPSVINNAPLIVGPDNRISFANHKAASMFRTCYLDQLIGQPVPRLRFAGSRFIALSSTSQFQDSAGQSAILSPHNLSGRKGIEKTLQASGQEGC